MYQNNSSSKQPPKGLVGALIKRRIAKDERQANQILVVILIVGVLMLIYINRPSAPAYSEEDRLMDELIAEEALDME